MKQESFDPGLTTQVSGELRRAINRDGSFNVRRKGLRWRDTNVYLHLTDTTWPRFLLFVAAIFLTVNMLFAFAYFALGVENLKGADTGLSGFWVAFFFSVHTLTTVGYGDVYPKSAHIATRSKSRIPSNPPRPPSRTGCWSRAQPDRHRRNRQSSACER